MSRIEVKTVYMSEVAVIVCVDSSGDDNDRGELNLRGCGEAH